MSTDLINAAFAGETPDAAFAALNPQADNLADGIGSSYGIIGYKGKVWTLRLRGQSYQFNRPDDGSPAPYLDVIILRQLPAKSKSYYPPNSYQDGQLGTRPICSALNGETPDEDVMEPQAKACAICPKNVFKTAPDGRKTRECSDYKRLAVLIVPSQSRAALGAPLLEPVFLRVPAASLNALAKQGENMSAQGFHYSSYITRIGFDPEKPHPQMTFKAFQKLSAKEAPVVLPMREDPMALRITGEADLAAVARTARPALPATPAPAPAPAPAVAPETIDTGFGDVTATVTKQASQQPPAAAPGSLAIDAGFGDMSEPAAPAPVRTTKNTAEDIGEPDEADADLDARIAALLPR
jgi:hypothetical protein